MSDHDPRMLEPMARAIFTAALEQGRSGELLAALFDGGTATCSPDGNLWILPADHLAALLGDD